LILEYLESLGITDRSFASALGEDVADKVREHFRATTQNAAAPAHKLERDEVRQALSRPLERSMAEIRKASGRPPKKPSE